MKSRARSVGMLVYIETASAMNRDEFGGTARADRSLFRSKLLLKYDHCAFAAICTLSLTHTPIAWVRHPEHDTIGRFVVFRCSIESGK
jgi:hypothetical protein